ncbi:MAG: hypothetical protein F6K58_17460 [Symploca sp. SIO2E9]|nr:hypothetical protein [Symploca sp. SIO2E9]
MVIRIRVTRPEFEAASNHGYVYGQIIRRRIFPVYVELGIESNYLPFPKDDPKTEYRFFKDCHLYLAETEEQLDREEYLSESLGIAIVIYS